MAFSAHRGEDLGLAFNKPLYWSTGVSECWSGGKSPHSEALLNPNTPLLQAAKAPSHLPLLNTGDSALRMSSLAHLGLLAPSIPFNSCDMYQTFSSDAASPATRNGVPS